MKLRLLLNLEPMNRVQSRMETDRGFRFPPGNPNTKLEGRNSKGARNARPENPRRPPSGVSDFGFWTSLGFRISDFGLLSRPTTARLLLAVLLLTTLGVRAQTADDFFHGGALNYLSNNIPQALAVVSNGLAIFPSDIKLKKLEELLKQQQQQPQQEEQQKQEQQQDQQAKQDQKDQQQKQDEAQSQQQAENQEQEQEQDQQQGKQDEQSREKPDETGQPMAAHSMTPQEAQRLLDAQKDDEKVLQFVPQGEPKRQGRMLKDW